METLSVDVSIYCYCHKHVCLFVAMLSSSDDPMLVNTKPDPLDIKLEPMTTSYSTTGAGVSSPSPRAQSTSFSVTKNLLQQPPAKVPKKVRNEMCGCNSLTAFCSE